jgi:hypothetical protein
MDKPNLTSAPVGVEGAIINAREIAEEVHASYAATGRPECDGETLDHLMDRLEGLVSVLSFLPVQGDMDIAIRCRRAAAEAEGLLDAVHGQAVPEQSARLVWRLVDSVARYFEEKTGLPVGEVDHMADANRLLRGVRQ